MAGGDVGDWCDQLLGVTGRNATESPDGTQIDLASFSIDDFDASPEQRKPSSSSSHEAAVKLEIEGSSETPVEPEAQPRELGPDLGPTSSETPVEPEDPILQDTVYRNWVPRIRGPLGVLKQLRGPFQRDVVCASLFDGMKSERQVLRLFSVPTKWLFSMEKKDAANNFAHHHFPLQDHEHHFLDARHFLDGLGKGECFNHAFTLCSLGEIAEFLIDILFVTCSCQPYSKAGKNRMKPGAVEAHAESYHLEVFYEIFRRVKAKAVVFENVFGFALATSINDPSSPMRKMLERLQQEFPDWSVGIFVVEGNVFLVLIRHRLFMVFVHTTAGGSEVIAMLRRVIEV